MDKLSSRSVFIALGGAALVALVTGWLRAQWVWWWPAVSFSSDGGSSVYFLWLLIAGLLGPVLGTLWRRRQWLYMAAAMVGVLIGFAVGTSRAQDADVMLPWSREYAMMMYLLKVATPSIASSKITGGMMGTTIAVVDEAGINNAAIRLRKAICEGFEDDFLTNIITVGGPDAAVTGRVLQKAVRWLPRYRGSRLEIIVVTPSPVPDNGKQALQEKGLRFREIEHQFPDALPQSGLTRSWRRE